MRDTRGNAGREGEIGGVRVGWGTDNPVAGYYPIREENKYRSCLYSDKAEISYCRLGLLYGS